MIGVTKVNIDENGVVRDDGGTILFVDCTQHTNKKWVVHEGTIYRNISYEWFNSLSNTMQKQRIATYKKTSSLSEAVERTRNMDTYCVITHLGKCSDTKSGVVGYVEHGTTTNDRLIYASTVNLDSYSGFTNRNAHEVSKHKFLFETVTVDGMTIHQGLSMDNQLLVQEIENIGVSYEQWKKEVYIPKPNKNSIMVYEDKQFKDINDINENGELVNPVNESQIEFPVKDGYVVIHMITDISLQYEMTDRIFRMDMQKGKNKRRIPILITTHYGGTQPQNFGALNQSHRGERILLESLPPQIKRNYHKKLKCNFFNECLCVHDYSRQYKQIYSLNKREAGTSTIKKVFKDIICDIIGKADILREQKSGWTKNTSFGYEQKCWLDSAYDDETKEWKDRIANNIVEWVNRGYHKVCGDDLIEVAKSDMVSYAKKRL